MKEAVIPEELISFLQTAATDPALTQWLLGLRQFAPEHRAAMLREWEDRIPQEEQTHEVKVALAALRDPGTFDASCHTLQELSGE